MAGVLDVEDTAQKRRKEEGGGHRRHGCMRGNNIETRGVEEVGGETVI